MKLFAAISLLLIACSAEQFPILYPEDTNPAWAQRACGKYANMCFDGGCCPQGWYCTSNRYPQSRAYSGYCSLDD